MKSFIRELTKQMFGLLAVFIFLAGLLSVAVGVFDSSHQMVARGLLILGGVVVTAASIALLLWTKPKDTEGSILYMLLELLNIH